jgi:hypothetical protein
MLTHFFGWNVKFCSRLTSQILDTQTITWCNTGNEGARKLEIYEINEGAQKMREHRLCGNGISNYESQMTTAGVRGDFMIWWCEQHHGI